MINSVINWVLRDHKVPGYTLAALWTITILSFVNDLLP